MAALAAQGGGGAAGARWQWRNRRRSTFGLARQLLPMGARTMFIQTQSTPNPESLMFVPGRCVRASCRRVMLLLVNPLLTPRGVALLIHFFSGL